MVDESWHFWVDGTIAIVCLFNMHLAKAMGNETLLDTERDKEMKNTVFAFKKIMD